MPTTTNLTAPAQRFPHRIGAGMNSVAPQRLTMTTPRTHSVTTTRARPKTAVSVAATRPTAGILVHRVHNPETRCGQSHEHPRMGRSRVRNAMMAPADSGMNQLPSVGGIHIRTRRTHRRPPVLTPAQHLILTAEPINTGQVNRAGAVADVLHPRPPPLEAGRGCTAQNLRDHHVGEARHHRATRGAPSPAPIIMKFTLPTPTDITGTPTHRAANTVGWLRPLRSLRHPTNQHTRDANKEHRDPPTHRIGEKFLY